MIYLKSFKISDKQVKCPNIYPYNVFRGKYVEPFIFEPITVFYGNNGSGKSTLLNIIANKLEVKGRENPISNALGYVDYCNKFTEECGFCLSEDDNGWPIKELPANSRYIKSEDILYEIKKIQQTRILGDGMVYDLVQEGKTKEEAEKYLASKEGSKLQGFIEFSQEKYSNGETSMKFFDKYLIPDALYLLDEPEVSLSPANQVALAENLNNMARFLGCQFIVATHSPYLLGTINAKIYDIDSKEYDVKKWSELENVRYFYNFFKKHEADFI